MVQAWGFGARGAHTFSQIRGLIIEILFLLQSQTKCRLFPLAIKAPRMRANRRARLFFFRLMKPKCCVCRRASEHVRSECRLEGQGQGGSCQFGRITANWSLMEIRSTACSHVTYRTGGLMELIWAGHSSFVLFIHPSEVCLIHQLAALFSVYCTDNGFTSLCAQCRSTCASFACLCLPSVDC